MSHRWFKARCNPGNAVVVLLLALGFSVGAAAQTVSIEAGAVWQIDDGLMDMGCATVHVTGTLHLQNGRVDGVDDLRILGQVSADTATLEIGGDWNNLGSFQAGTGTVRFVDRCNRAQSSLAGNTSFSTLTLESARGKSHRFPAGMTQTVSHTLRLAGASGQLLGIASTQPGTQAGLALAVGGAQQIGWVRVADMTAPAGSAWLAPGPAQNFDSVDAGNNSRWFQQFLAPKIIPTASGWALLVLTLALGLLARRAFRLR